MIHTQFMYGVGLEGLAAAKILRKPLVGTNHTALGEFLRFGPIQKEWFKKSILRYQAWYYNFCSLVTSPSDIAFKEMLENGFDRPHRTLSNPIDPVFKPASVERKKELKKKFGLSELAVCCVGRLGPEKNVDVVIRAMAIVKEKIPSVNLAIAGHGSEFERLKKLTVELGIEKNVKFLGTLPKSGVAEVYGACETFAIASTSETQSMTLTQSLSCGLPAVGVRALALPEFINEWNGFIVEPGDYRALAEKLKIILTDDILRKKLGAGGKESVGKFRVENIAKEWENIYVKAIKNHEKSK
ncbi:MAG: glycosyltransferase [Minisyncoccia bacterium]